MSVDPWTGSPFPAMWLWASTQTRTHLILAQAEPTGWRVRTDPRSGRAVTLCGRSGPLLGKGGMKFVDRNSPPECKICWRRWVALADQTADEHSAGGTP